MSSKINRQFLQTLFASGRLEDAAIYIYTTTKEYNVESNAFLYICSIQEIHAQLSKLTKLNFLFSIKSIISTDTSAGNGASSDVLRQANPNRAPSTICNSMKNIGGLFVGKNNGDEFACGVDGTTSYYGPSLIDGKNPGGSSSGGSASIPYAVDIAIGTDTGGSCRLTSCTTGLSIGFKPTFGAISRHGSIQYADSFDTIGFMYSLTKTDLAISVFKAIRSNSRDSCGIQYHDADDVSPEDPNIAVLTYNTHKEPQFSYIFSMLSKHYSLQRIVQPKFSLMAIVATYSVLTSCEFFSSLTKFNPIRYRTEAIKFASVNEIGRNRFQYLQQTAKAKVLAGVCILSTQQNRRLYYNAINMRSCIIDYVLEALKTYHFIILPAYNLAETTTNEALEGYYFLANLVGLPAITITINGTSITVMARKRSDVALMKFVNHIQQLCQKKNII